MIKKLEMKFEIHILHERDIFTCKRMNACDTKRNQLLLFSTVRISKVTLLIHTHMHENI